MNEQDPCLSLTVRLTQIQGKKYSPALAVAIDTKTKVTTTATASALQKMGSKTHAVIDW